MQGSVLGAGVKAKPRCCAQGALVIEAIKYIHPYYTRHNVVSAMRAKMGAVCVQTKENQFLLQELG